jgi:hypothetical protein
MSKTPPVPPEQRSNKGHWLGSQVRLRGEHSRTRELRHQGRQGNIKQNTTNQGLAGSMVPHEANEPALSQTGAYLHRSSCRIIWTFEAAIES